MTQDSKIKRREGVDDALRVSPAVTRLTVYRRLQVWFALLLIRVFDPASASSLLLKEKREEDWLCSRIRVFDQRNSLSLAREEGRWAPFLFASAQKRAAALLFGKATKEVGSSLSEETRRAS